MSKAAVQAVLSPLSVAVVGATDRMQYGGRLLANLLKAPPPGGVWPVNPGRTEVMGARCYPSLREVPAPVDLAAVIVPAAHVVPVLEDCAAKNVRAAVVISAGYAERADAEGQARQAELLAAIRRTGVRVVGPNCLGVSNLAENIHPHSHLHGVQQAKLGQGGIALLSHSGATAFGPIAAACRDRAIDLEYIVTLGNELDLTMADFIDAWVDDPRVRAVAVLAEGIKDGPRFVAAARRSVRAGKPVVVLKIGRSAVGERAAATHTAALTGSWAACKAAFRAAGVTLADDYDELVELSYCLGASRRPAGRRVAVISHSGGIGALVGDRLGEAGLEVPPLSAGGAARLGELLQGRGWPGNPADVTGNFQQPVFAEMLDLLLAEPVDMLVAATYGDRAAAHIAAAYQKSGKPVLALYTEGPAPEQPGLNLLRRAGVPVFYQPSAVARAARALAAPLPEEPPLPPADPWAAIPQPPQAVCRSPQTALAAAAAIGYPVVAKAEGILHKTEAGGVRLGLEGPAALSAAYAVLSRLPGATGVRVQAQVQEGIEVLVGVTRDATFGRILLLGLGGVQAEALGAVSHRLCPISEGEAEAMIEEVPGLSRLLAGFRGRPPGDRAALVRALAAASHLEEEVDINPLLVLPAGVLALDVKG